jgi:GNAT superfamily N-acetyltransferase
MTDMLVKLYDLRNDWSFVAQQAQLGIAIRKPIGPEHDTVVNWVREKFGAGWACETRVALNNRPVTCWIAVKDGTLHGFACYDATGLGTFGPTGVDEVERGKGTGKALLMACLLDMKLKGYAYCAIGWAGLKDFYRKAAGAVEIPDSEPGFYQGMLRIDD